MPLPRPPSADPLVALADRCVQCGLCLPACPTYAHERQETESPRGRIALARAWALGRIAPTGTGDRHLDNCLGCRNCEAACPAGVRFGELLVAARARQRDRRPPSRRQAILEALVARPRLLAALIDAYSLLARHLPRRWRRLPSTRPAFAPDTALRAILAAAPGGRPVHGDGTATHGPVSPACDAPPSPGPGPAAVLPLPVLVAPDARALADAEAPTVSLFVGCAARAYERPLRTAFTRLAAAAGCRVETPVAQTCCGALHAHAGDLDRADALARVNARSFEGAALVATLASGCHEAVAGSVAARSLDALDLLAARASRLRFRPTPLRIALHLPCTQRNVVRSVAATRTLLAAVPGLTVVELAGSGCCGAAGTRMFTDPAQAAVHRAPLLDALDASAAPLLLSANLGCRLHLGAATRVPVRHPIEFLAECLDGEPTPRG